MDRDGCSSLSAGQPQKIRKQVVVEEARGVGLGLAERVAVALAVPVAALVCVALGVGEWLGVAEREGLAVTERLVPRVPLARPVEVAPGEETGITLAAPSFASESPPWKVMKPIAPTATAAAVAPPSTTERFLRRAAFARAWPAVDWLARPGVRRSRRRAPGPVAAACAGAGSQTALIAGP